MGNGFGNIADEEISYAYDFVATRSVIRAHALKLWKGRLSD
jgi:hypothetical protein